MFSLNLIDHGATRAQILGMPAEGTTARATARMVGVSFNTLSKLQLDIGEAAYQDEHLRDLDCKRSRRMRLGASSRTGAQQARRN